MMTIAKQMLHELPGEAQMTRRLLERIPDEKLSWSPPANCTRLAGTPVT